MLNAVIRFALHYRLVILALSLVVLIYGSYLATTLPIDVFPDLDRPRVVVLTECPGMATEEVEALVTYPIEISNALFDALLQMGEYNRFSKGLFAWIGFPTATVDYTNAARQGGGATRWTREASVLKNVAANPYSVSLASLMTSSSSRKGMRATAGPKISSVATRLSWARPFQIVGSTQEPPSRSSPNTGALPPCRTVAPSCSASL